MVIHGHWRSIWARRNILRVALYKVFAISRPVHLDVTEADISFDEQGEPKAGPRNFPIPPVLAVAACAAPDQRCHPQAVESEGAQQGHARATQPRFQRRILRL